MTTVSIVFPNQLFRQHPALAPGRTVVLIEEHLFFRQFAFHQRKLHFHRASMRFYADYLQAQGYQVRYINALQPEADIRTLLPMLHTEGVQEIHYADPCDNWLEKRLLEACTAHSISRKVYPSPLFLNSTEELDAYFAGKRNYLQADFYKQQRRRFEVLLDDADKPLGGKWSYDDENRLKYPKGKQAPKLRFPPPNAYTEEADSYIAAHFQTNPGILHELVPYERNACTPKSCHFAAVRRCSSVAMSRIAPSSRLAQQQNGGDLMCSNFVHKALDNYPIDFESSEQWLQDFLLNRFREFGPYEDALVAGEHFLHHSVLTPMLNVGLLEPRQVLRAVLEHDVPLNSKEGFVRQLIGWREFMRGVYLQAGSAQRTRNYWGFSRRIPASFYTGTTGIWPVDEVIQKVLKTGYCHHIERLMVLGNFMLLCEFDPDEVYRWFMELFIDAYDWVMVPNVYGMSQFADGGLLATKPYLSGSNYLRKMSNYPNGPWQATWDGLFWRFMHVHRDYFLQNPRLGMLLRTFDKMPAEKRQTHLDNAEAFLISLDN